MTIAEDEHEAYTAFAFIIPGHQKKMMLAIERLKRIQSGSRRLSTLEKSRSGNESMLEPASTYPTPQWLMNEHSSGPQHYHHHSQLVGAMAAPPSPSHYGSAQQVAIITRPKRSGSGESLTKGPTTPELRTFQGSTENVYRKSNNLVYQPDVVAIQLNRSSSMRTGSLTEDDKVIYESFHGPSGSPSFKSSGSGHFFNDSRKRSSFDRSSTDDLDGLATIRRPSAKVSPRVAPKPRPVAKIIAKTKRASRDFASEIIKMDGGNFYPNATNSLDRKMSFNKSVVEPIYDLPADFHKPLYVSTEKHSTPPQSPNKSKQYSPGHYAPGSNASPQHSPGHYASSPVGKVMKKAPPPPPKRTNSIKSDSHPHLKNNIGQKQSQRKTEFTKDVTPPRPPLPQGYIASPPVRHQTFNNDETSQSLKPNKEHEFQKTDESSSIKDKRHEYSKSSSSISSLANVPEPMNYTPSQSEDFPPPPPPISTSPSHTKSLAQNTSNQETRISESLDTDNPLSDVIEQLERKTGNSDARQIVNQEWQDSGTDESGSDSDSGYEPKHGLSIAQCAAYTGSTDTLPFANENVGTIKSRNQSSKPSIITVSNDEGEDGERVVDVDTSFFEDSGTIKRKPKPTSDQCPPPCSEQASYNGKCQ